jgi:enoyl-CoA hydratase/carnithine racemase
MSTTEALTNALVLAILAPDQERADRAIAMAEEIASRLTPKQIASAKRAAIKLTK